jgi:DNA-binding XRE family transcriptional regulator
MTNTTHANVYPFSADGKELAQWRKDQGLRKDQLGEIIGYSGKAIGNWETGRYMPRSDAVSKLAMLGFRFSRLDLDARSCRRQSSIQLAGNATRDPARPPSRPRQGVCRPIASAGGNWRKP